MRQKFVTDVKKHKGKAVYPLPYRAGILIKKDKFGKRIFFTKQEYLIKINYIRLNFMYTV